MTRHAHGKEEEEQDLFVFNDTTEDPGRLRLP